MKTWLISLAVAGMAVLAPALASADYHPHGGDWPAAHAIRGGDPDLDRDGWVSRHEVGRMRREAYREDVRRHWAARARFHHRMRARAYAEEARRAAHRAHYEAARGYW